MSLAYVGDSNAVASTTTATPTALGAGVAQTGDHAFVVVVNKRPAFTPATPSGWTQVVSAQVGGGTAGVGDGPLRVSLFYQQVPSGTWTLPGFGSGGGTGAVISAGLTVWRTDAGETLSITATSGSDTNASTTFSVVGGSTLALSTGDALVVASGLTSNTPTLSSPALSATGATFGTINSPWSSSSGSADTLRSAVYRAPVTAGSATAAPVFTATASTSTGATGGSVFMALRATATGTARVKTGGAVLRAAGGGPKAKLRSRTGAGAARAAGHGPRQTVRDRTGGATVRGSGGSTGSGQPSGYGVGGYGLGGYGTAEVIPVPPQDKTGGAVTRGVISGARDIATEILGGGGSVLRGGGSGQLEVESASVIDMTGGGKLTTGGTGTRIRDLGVRTGGGAARMAAGGVAVSEYSLSGGCGLTASGSGVLEVEVLPIPAVRTDPPMTVTVDQVVAGGAYDSPTIVVDDVEFVLTNLTGWYGSPQTRTSRTPRLGAAGSHRRPAYKDTRSVEITVTATSCRQDPQVMRQVEKVLAATCADPDRLYPLRVTDHDGVTCAYVELDGAVAHQLRDGLAWSSVIAIPVMAPDPRRFATDWTTSSTGPPTVGAGGVVAVPPGVRAVAPGVDAGRAGRPSRVTVTGEGTAARLPLVFQISGPASDVTIVNSDTAFVLGYRGVLGAADTVWINCDDQPAHDVPGAPGPIPARGAILSNGANARSAVTRFGAWPQLHPGDVIGFFLAGTFTAAGAHFAVHTRAAYI